jgi:hypothetical protein
MKYEERGELGLEVFWGVCATVLCGNSCVYTTALKVPKQENFVLALFTLSYPIRVGDLGT